MNMLTRQTGFTFGGLVVLLIVGGIIVTVGLKLGPFYMENATIQSVLDSLKEDAATLDSQSPEQIRSTLNKRLAINGIKRVGSDFAVERNGASTTVSIEYEARTNFISNVDLVIAFSNSVELPNN